MLPLIKLSGNIDILSLSPLARGVHLTVSSAAKAQGIDLTEKGRMNRRFVRWAAENFNWPGFRADHLLMGRRVLNEADMLPLQAVRDSCTFLKLLNADRQRLLASDRGRAYLKSPQKFFDRLATHYLYAQIERRAQARAYGGEAWMRSWAPVLHAIDIMGEAGCTAVQILQSLHPHLAPLSAKQVTLQAWSLKTELKGGMLRPLCWLGLLHEDREGLSPVQDGIYHKTPLWFACLRLHEKSEAHTTLH